MEMVMLNLRNALLGYPFYQHNLYTLWYHNKTVGCATRNLTHWQTAVPTTTNLVGITRKDGAASEAMGLNPNLNIEDEYVENLLKQVHFLNLEIKLVYAYC